MDRLVQVAAWNVQALTNYNVRIRLSTELEEKLSQSKASLTAFTSSDTDSKARMDELKNKIKAMQERNDSENEVRHSLKNVCERSSFL